MVGTKQGVAVRGRDVMQRDAPRLERTSSAELVVKKGAQVPNLGGGGKNVQLKRGQ